MMGTKKPLFYSRITALSKQNHGAYCLDERPDYLFAKEANSVPLGVSEFASACQSFPIVFLLEQKQAAPVAVLNVHEHQNRWVSSDGAWQGSYIPAYIRRYPFIVVKVSETESALCIDESSNKLNRESRGLPLFDDDETTDVLQKNRDFAIAYEAELLRNRHFSELLMQHELLEPVQLHRKADSDKAILSGFYVVSRSRLEQLDDDAVAALHKAGGLELIYQHLLSLQMFQKLASLSGAADQSVTEGAV